MEIWVVEHGDQYEGAYGHEYFMNEKSAVYYARNEFGIREFTMYGKSYMHEGRNDYVNISPAKVNES